MSALLYLLLSLAAPAFDMVQAPDGATAGPYCCRAPGDSDGGPDT